MRSIVWFRGKDLRVNDHPALSLAGPDALLVFVVDPYFFVPERAEKMPHRMQFLVQSLTALEERICTLGGKLWFVPGRSVEVIPRLARIFGADQVVAMRWSEPFGRERDRRIAESMNIPLVLLEGETLLPPGKLRTKAGRPYSVFTPFARSFRRSFSVSEKSVFTAFGNDPGLPAEIERVPCPTLKDLKLEKKPGLVTGGEMAAEGRLDTFLAGPGVGYRDRRNRLDCDGTSRLSTDLKFGLLSVREVWRRVVTSALPEADKLCFTNELIWREFNYSTLWDSPHVLSKPFKSKWERFPWDGTTEHLEAWKSGCTGYPVVDAAARQLLESGFVHNRARMIAASFLTKHLMVNYRHGEAHYLQWLTDGDWAQNSMGWQWAAGCGADAQPWFRVFNPMTQGKKFDPSGEYVKRWVPELRQMDPRHIHAPWIAPTSVLKRAGVILGETYPSPVVDHSWARQRFLGAAKDFFAA